MSVGGEFKEKNNENGHNDVIREPRREKRERPGYI